MCKERLWKWLKRAVYIGLYAGVVAIGLMEVYEKEVTAVFALPTGQRVVVVDAGHGGWDPWG